MGLEKINVTSKRQDYETKIQNFLKISVNDRLSVSRFLIGTVGYDPNELALEMTKLNPALIFHTTLYQLKKTQQWCNAQPKSKQFKSALNQDPEQNNIYPTLSDDNLFLQSQVEELLETNYCLRLVDATGNKEFVLCELDKIRKYKMRNLAMFDKRIKILHKSNDSLIQECNRLEQELNELKSLKNKQPMVN